jgi:hypothetical protein
MAVESSVRTLSSTAQTDVYNKVGLERAKASLENGNTRCALWKQSY